MDHTVYTGWQGKYATFHRITDTNKFIGTHTYKYVYSNGGLTANYYIDNVLEKTFTASSISSGYGPKYGSDFGFKVYDFDGTISNVSVKIVPAQ